MKHLSFVTVDTEHAAAVRGLEQSSAAGAWLFRLGDRRVHTALPSGRRIPTVSRFQFRQKGFSQSSEQARTVLFVSGRNSSDLSQNRGRVEEQEARPPARRATQVEQVSVPVLHMTGTEPISLKRAQADGKPWKLRRTDLRAAWQKERTCRMFRSLTPGGRRIESCRHIQRWRGLRNDYRYRKMVQS